jgi:hypothetical protein
VLPVPLHFVSKIACAARTARLEDAMPQRDDDPTRDDWIPEPERRSDTDEVHSFEKAVSDTGTDYDAGFDENMVPLDETEEINEHGSER